MIERDLIEKAKLRFSTSLLERLDAGNSEIRILPVEMAPAPPQEENKPTRERFYREQLSTKDVSDSRNRGAIAARKVNLKRSNWRLTPEQCAEAKRRLLAGDGVTSIARDLSVSRDCIYKIQSRGVPTKVRAPTRAPDPDCSHDNNKKCGPDIYGKARRRCADCGRTWRIEEESAA